MGRQARACGPRRGKRESVELHHVVIERWSRQDSVLHRRDARIKLIALGACLVGVATTDPFGWMESLGFGLLFSGGVLAARLPLGALLLRGLVVVPFSGVFSLLAFVTGDSERAFALLAKSYLSALAVLLLAATTPMPALLHGAASLGAPKALVQVLQFLYRYLFVVSEQAQHMWAAASCRGLQFAGSRRRDRWQAARGVLAVLFVRSYERAETIQRAMLARGFDGRMHLISATHVGRADVVFLAGVTAVVLLLRYCYSSM